ncbi:MAG: dirigent protein [Actinobacteria bacterium]|nr:dirigent protein [Actinomycetota bacterium]
MRRLTIFGGVAVATVLTLTLIAIRPADSASGKVVRIYEHDTSQTPIDLGDKGESPGDLFVYSGDVFNKKGGKNIGRAAGQCLTVSTGSAHAESICSVHVTLAGGKIIGEGLANTADIFGGKTVSFPITGGSGIYRNARGYATVTVPQVPNLTDAIFVFYLD